MFLCSSFHDKMNDILMIIERVLSWCKLLAVNVSADDHSCDDVLTKPNFSLRLRPISLPSLLSHPILSRLPQLVDRSLKLPSRRTGTPEHECTSLIANIVI